MRERREVYLLGTHLITVVVPIKHLALVVSSELGAPTGAQVRISGGEDEESSFQTGDE